MHKRLVSLFCFAIFATTIGITLFNDNASATVPGVNQLVSTSYTGTTLGNDSSTGSPFISSNGKFVAFKTDATNILPSGGKGAFLRNLTTNTSVRLNVSTAGVIADNNVNISGISATGRYVIFNSQATNLIDGVTMPSTDSHVYLRDTVTNTTTLISKNSSDTPANGSDARGQGVSSDGRFVMFVSDATNLVSDVTTPLPHLYMLDRTSSSLTLLDRRWDGTPGYSNYTWPPYGSMSCDGSLIAFQYPSNLLSATSLNYMPIYILDRRAGNEISNILPTQNGSSFLPKFSCNGDYIGFTSRATNIDTSVSASQKYHPYIYDRINKTFSVADTSNTTGTTPVSNTCTTGVYCIDVSNEGLGIFQANTTELTGASGQQIYIHDIASGTTALLSRDSSGNPGNNGSNNMPTISEDGSMGAYTSAASNLVSGDTNNKSDIFTSLTGF